MANIPLPNNTQSLFRIDGQDATGTVRATSGTMTVSDVVHCYVAKVAGQANQYVIVSRNNSLPAGGSTTVTVTENAVDDRGNALPPLVQTFDLSGPPLPPPATHLVLSEGPINIDQSGGPKAADPGSATIAL
jgi:hypothetical protein